MSRPGLVLAASLAILSILATVPGSIANGPRDAAEFTYAHGLQASGTLAGECALAGVRFPANEPRAVTFHTRGATLAVYETRLNVTQLHGPVPTGWTHVEGQTATRHELPQGQLIVHAPPGSHVTLTHKALDETKPSMRALVQGATWSTGAPDKWFAVATGYDHRYIENRSGHLVLSPQSVPGPAFTLRPGPGPYAVSGDGFVKMDSTRVTATDFDLTLPPLRRVVHEVALPLLTRQTVLETFAVLTLDGFETSLSGARTEPICQALTWTGTGSVLYRTAAGWAARGSERHDFDRKEFVLNGTLQGHETAVAADSQPGAPVYMRGRAEGQFQAIGLDFALVSAPTLDLPLKRLGLVAVALAAAAWAASNVPRFVALFYTRVGVDRALTHPVRAQLHDAAHARPGLILKDFVQVSGRAYAVVRHHVDVLERVGLLRTLRHGSQLHVYPAQANLREARRALTRAGDAPAAFLADWAGPTGRSTRDAVRLLRERFGLSRVGAWKVVWRAERAGLVVRRDGPEGSAVQSLL
jgi:hypothetical protein